MTTQEIKALLATKRKKTKYSNIKVEVDGIRFDSKKEANYYGKLKLLQKSGDVISFELQPKFDMIINGKKCGFYKADFRVVWRSSGEKIVDVKGVRTSIYMLKKRIVEALYGIKIIEM